MIKIYDLSRHPQLGEVLTCRLYKPGASLECARFTAAFGNQHEPLSVHLERDPETSFAVVMIELRDFYKFIDSPHWRDSVAKQWQKIGIFSDVELSPANYAD